MISAMLSLLLASTACEAELKDGQPEKLLRCAETQSGWWRRYLFARAFYALGSTRAGDHEGAQAQLLGTPQQVAAMKEDLTVARIKSEQIAKPVCTGPKVCTSNGGGISWAGLKKFDGLSETERKRFESLSTAELKVLLHVPQAELDKATEPRGLRPLTDER